MENVNIEVKDEQPQEAIVTETVINDDTVKKNNVYLKICMYTIGTVVICSLFIKIIFNYDEFQKFVSDLFRNAQPFIIGFFISYIINPVVKIVDKSLLGKLFKIRATKIRKIIAIVISYVIFLAMLVLLLIYVLPEVLRSLQNIINFMPKYFSMAYDRINGFFESIEKKFPDIDISYFKHQVEGALPELFNFGTDYMGKMVSNIISISFSILETIYTVIVAIIVSTYMIADRKLLTKNMAKFVYALFPRRKADVICETAAESNIIFYNYVISKAVDSFIIGMITFIAMTLLQLDYPLMISIFVGVTNMIPYFGPFLGAAPGIIILFIISPVKALIFAIMILIIQQFDGLYLGPKLLGDSVGLSPLWIIFGITIGGAYFGVIGMFLGVPVIAVIAHLLSKYVVHRLNKKKLNDAFFSEYDEEYQKKSSTPKEFKVRKPKKISFFEKK